MIPSVLSPEVKSNAERKVFEWFQSAPDTDDWIVLHSLGIISHKHLIYGEIDFLVLAPGLGIFALEVKGGRIRRENGIWYFKDKYDHEDHRCRGPFDQARDGIFSVIESLKARLDTSHLYLKNIFFGYGVMFPDVEYTSIGIDEVQWQVFDCLNGRKVKEYIRKLAYASKILWENIYGTLPLGKIPDKEDIQYITSLLRGDFEYTLSLRTQIKNADDAIIRMTAEQYRCLDQLDDNPRCLIQGLAGSGKTLLALEEVKKSVARGEKVALFCFNANLADWFTHYFKNQPDILRPLFIGTFHSFMRQLSNKNVLIPSYPRSPDALTKYYQETLPQYASLVLKHTESSFEKIIIDEAQDLISDPYLDVLNACLSKGFRRGHWIMFGDFSMQAIYSNNLPATKMLEKLECMTSFIRFKLTKNCRNTKPIGTEITTLSELKSVDNFWTNIDGPPVQYITWASREDQYNKLQALLLELKNAHIAPEQITILSPSKREDSVVSMISNYDIPDYSLQHKMNIMYCSIQGFKGLENSVIILADIENYKSKQLIYVGLSRASSVLYVLESETAKKERDNLIIRSLLQ